MSVLMLECVAYKKTNPNTSIPMMKWMTTKCFMFSHNQLSNVLKWSTTTGIPLGSITWIMWQTGTYHYVYNVMLAYDCYVVMIHFRQLMEGRKRDDWLCIMSYLHEVSSEAVEFHQPQEGVNQSFRPNRVKLWLVTIKEECFIFIKLWIFLLLSSFVPFHFIWQCHSQLLLMWRWFFCR